MSGRCPEPEPKLADIMIAPWQNFDGENGEYRQRMIALGVNAAPAHARLEITHSCGWAVALRPGPYSAARVFADIAEHLGVTVIDAGVAEAVDRNQPDQHSETS